LFSGWLLSTGGWV